MSPIVVNLLLASAGLVKNIVVDIVMIVRVIMSFLRVAEAWVMVLCLGFWYFWFLLILNLDEE